MSPGKDELYILGRDEKESSRYLFQISFRGVVTNLMSCSLDEQHAFVLEVVGGPIHESVPENGLFAIADIATGTGYLLLCLILALPMSP